MVGRFILLLTAMLLMLSSGCRDEAQRFATARGMVTVAGQPLSGAAISLVPIGDTTGPKATAMVLDGKFDIGPEAGLAGGVYQVRFTMMPAEVRGRLPTDIQSRLSLADAVIDPRFDANSQLEWNLITTEDNSRTFQVTFKR